MKYISTLALIAVLVPSMAGAVTDTVSNAGEAGVNVVNPVEVQVAEPLYFGTVTNTGGTVTVNMTGERTATSDILVNDPLGPTPATMYVSGHDGGNVSYTLPATVTISGMINPSNTLTVNLSDREGETSMLGGLGMIQHGGSVTIPANTDADTYQGSYPVTVTY